MSEKNTVLVFTENNARILTNPPDLDAWKGHPRAVVNAERPAGVPLHFLKLEDGRVLEMTDEEKAARLAHHERHGVINELPESPGAQAAAERVRQAEAEYEAAKAHVLQRLELARNLEVIRLELERRIRVLKAQAPWIGVGAAALGFAVGYWVG